MNPARTVLVCMSLFVVLWLSVYTVLTVYAATGP